MTTTQWGVVTTTMTHQMKTMKTTMTHWTRTMTTSQQRQPMGQKVTNLMVIKECEGHDAEERA